jgi:hypothetical protein
MKKVRRSQATHLFHFHIYNYSSRENAIHLAGVSPTQGQHLFLECLRYDQTAGETIIFSLDNIFVRVVNQTAKSSFASHLASKASGRASTFPINFVTKLAGFSPVKTITFQPVKESLTMLNKIKFALMSGTLLSLAFTAVLVFAPASVTAQIAPAEDPGGEGPVYSAGHLRRGTLICRCPADPGDCACELSGQ